MTKAASLLRLSLITAALLCAPAWGGLSLEAKKAEKNKTKAGPTQPLPFSHKVHMSMGLKCANCHELEVEGYTAGLPDEKFCMGCHAGVKTDSPAIQKLAVHAEKGTAVRWVRIYRVPDYVYFSHWSHYKEAEIGCETCHGKVAQQDVLSLVRPTTMTACMDCHEEKKAPNDCNLCHDPA